MMDENMSGKNTTEDLEKVKAERKKMNLKLL